MAYILRSLDREGNIGVYTGKAGAEWVSANSADAFVYSSLAHARGVAERHNKFEPVHGLWFLPLTPAQVAAQVEKQRETDEAAR